MQRLIEQGTERFAQGFSIMMYPEGTRIAVGRRGIYKLGGAVIAVQHRRARPAGRAQRRARVAAQLVPQASRQGDRGDRPADRQRRPHARAADAPGRGLDRRRDGAADAARGDRRIAAPRRTRAPRAASRSARRPPRPGPLRQGRARARRGRLSMSSQLELPSSPKRAAAT